MADRRAHRALPSEPKLAAHYKMVRTSTTSEYGAAWRKWLAGSLKHLDADMGLQLLSASEQKALSEGLDQSGGFVVPADVGVAIFARIGQRSVFRRYATVRPTAKDVCSQVTFMEHATSGSIYSSDWVASWAGEVPSQSDIDPRFGTLQGEPKPSAVCKPARAAVTALTRGNRTCVHISGAFLCDECPLVSRRRSGLSAPSNGRTRFVVARPIAG